VDRTTRTAFAVVLVAILILGGGAVALLGASGGGNATTPPPDTIEVVGVIVAVDSAGLGDVRDFTLRLDGGAQLTLGLDALENGTEFPPGHLAEHQATSQPVRVWYREVDGQAQAIRLADAAP
jgi:hypothetical protein